VQRAANDAARAACLQAPEVASPSDGAAWAAAGELTASGTSRERQRGAHQLRSGYRARSAGTGVGCLDATRSCVRLQRGPSLSAEAPNVSYACPKRPVHVNTRALCDKRPLRARWSSGWHRDPRFLQLACGSASRLVECGRATGGRGVSRQKPAQCTMLQKLHPVPPKLALPAVPIDWSRAASQSSSRISLAGDSGPRASATRAAAARCE
jgi:hypothetical protein